MEAVPVAVVAPEEMGEVPNVGVKEPVTEQEPEVLAQTLHSLAAAAAAAATAAAAAAASMVLALVLEVAEAVVVPDRWVV